MRGHGGIHALPIARIRRPMAHLAALAVIAGLGVSGAAAAATATAATAASIVATQPKPTAPAVADPQNAYLSAVVGSTGRFSEGAFPTSANAYKIMYGWPATGTSYTTINVDGTPLIFGDSGLTAGPTDTDANTNTASATLGGIATTQTIQLVNNPDTGRPDTAAITYTVRNADTVSHSVGVRMMNDVDVNDNDGAPFRLPTIGAVTTDQDLTGASIPDSFTVYQDLADAQHIAAARLSGAGATPPDRLVIGQWPILFSSPWDFTATGSVITSDSAYAVYWNPATLAPGQSRTVTTYYGLSDVTVDLTPPLALGLTGPTALSVVGNSYSPNPFTVTATVSDAGTTTATGATLTLSLPPGLHTSSPNPVAVGDLAPGGAEAQASWSVTADPSSNPLTISTYSVTAAATNAASKTVSRPVTRPSLVTCDDIFFLGVRGSGETAGDANGYGKEVDAIRQSFVAHLPAGVTHHEEALDYTAARVSTLVGGIFTLGITGGVSQYFASISDGNTKFIDTVAAEHRACPHEKIVVAGYSQGALVINMSVRSLAGVTGIAMVADPARVPNQIGTKLGTARPGFGIWQVANRRVSPLPSSFSGAFIQVCDAGDVVCDWSHRGSLFTALNRGAHTHENYVARDLSLLQRMGAHLIRSSGYTPTR